jgi:type IV secretion system protein VirB1
MTTLTMQAALAIALRCVSVDPNVMVGIAAHESHLNPFAIHDNAGGSYYPDTREKAIQILARLMTSGHGNLDVGLTQVNTRNFRWLGLTLETALDPCRSMAAGAKVLTAFSGYNTGSPTRGITNGYAAAVTASIQAVQRNANNLDPTTNESPMCPNTDPSGWHAIATRAGCLSPTDAWHTVPLQKEASQ